ncbi:MAG: hypothetical protein HOQ11_06440 [Gemmatimonadaceae bacterium]|nr:hypothetical protein [Gemmatimonadaceae bacterium]NUQ93153.1 hypothetical protein [Gemmatimonadaceae bacterium]NUR19550.1 hypothetical protein [Gemmatimonadaceae bacterium]NUS97026.1 hypothetical protein [Gemmatimonadaceae bacterium]
MRAGLRGAALVLALVAATARPAVAQGRVLVQGILDVEGWSTDSASALLARNDGRPAALARLCMWTAVEPLRGLVFYAQGEVEGGSALEESVELAMEQGGVRYTRSRALVLDAGMISPIVGMYANRHLSTRNPLIGEPDGYVVSYPFGARVSGRTELVDYRLGVVSLPVYNERYMPKPTAAPRIAVGGGITPYPGVRLGVSGTEGPYLDDDLPASALAGRGWRSYRQRVVASDVELSAGYADLRGELTHAWYDVPGRATAVHGASWYGEASYAITPRLYAALRVERNSYPYLEPVGNFWPAAEARVANGEVGVGYRLGAAQTLKLSYRRDRWSGPATARVALPDGHAVAVQLSSGFDLLAALDRARTR